MKKFIIVLLTILTVLTLVSCVENEMVATPQPEGEVIANDIIVSTEEEKVVEETKPVTDVPFAFDGLEITVSSQYEFTTVDNEYSDYHQQTSIRIPITVKNISTDFHCLNSFSFKMIGASGTDATDVNSYFEDDIFWNAGDLRPEASYTRYMYVLYEGDGLYTMIFDDWTNKIYIDLNIVANN